MPARNRVPPMLAFLGLVAAACGGEPGTQASGDGDGGPVECTGGWYEPANGLCWHPLYATFTRPDMAFSWEAAIAQCDRLSLGGYGAGSWRLPTITELRSLIRGCPATATGGTCGVTDSCWVDVCGGAVCWEGCTSGNGPTVLGCYWPEVPYVLGWCNWGAYWSSTTPPGAFASAWAVDFATASVFSEQKTVSDNVMCVRPGP
jgi:formylglycine-generating enzyme required for sulfatase activity